MATMILLARLILSVVFLVSGAAKLLDLSGSRQAMSDFGIPDKLRTPVSVLLPIAELAVSLMLLFPTLAWWGAIGATVLLAMFTTLIVTNLARGRKPDCHCFGQLRSKPIGWSTVIRNLVLAGLSVLIVWRGSAVPGPDVSTVPAPVSLWQLIGLCLAAAVLVLLAVEGWLLIHLLRQNGRLLLRIEVLESQILAGHGVQPQRALVTTPDNSKGNKMGLPIGAEAPMGLWGSDIQGKRLSLKSFCATDKPSLFLFSDPKCGPCLAMMRSVANWQREYARFLNIVVVSQGERETNRAKAIEHGLQNVMIQVGKEVSSAYKVFGTPSAVLILANGRIGTQTVGGVEAISQLVQDSIPIVPANATVALSGNKVLGRPGVRYERLDEEAV